MTTVRYKLTVAYRGTRYHGWQRQAIPPTWKGPVSEQFPGLMTVQETLSRALGEVLGHPATVVGSSRTDSGVHARGQVAHLDTTNDKIPPEALKRSVNARLPGDIVVRCAEIVHPQFDAIRWTLDKRYEYLLFCNVDRDPFRADAVFWRWKGVDFDRMVEAARHFVGTHDFAAFAKPGHGRESTVRTVLECSVTRRDDLIVIGVEGTGFLWNQVRIMAGTLVNVGEGHIEPGAIADMLASRDRRQSGSTAPAHGLWLDRIRHRESPEGVESADLSEPS